VNTKPKESAQNTFFLWLHPTQGASFLSHHKKTTLSTSGSLMSDSPPLGYYSQSCSLSHLLILLGVCERENLTHSQWWFSLIRLKSTYWQSWMDLQKCTILSYPYQLPTCDITHYPIMCNISGIQPHIYSTTPIWVSHLFSSFSKLIAKIFIFRIWSHNRRDL
jgi:hypothetical protein